MKSKRLTALAEYIEKNDKVIDVGCDHGYLSIYLKENKLCQEVIASDISINALQSAIENIKKSNLPIPTVVSDGLKNIDTTSYNTVVIAGMGTSTMKEILIPEKLTNIEKIVLQSNNELEELRKYLGSIGYFLKDNKIVHENDKYYEIMLFIKSNQKNSQDEIIYGIIKNENKVYYQYLLNKYQSIYQSLPNNADKELQKFKTKIEYLRKIS